MSNELTEEQHKIVNKLTGTDVHVVGVGDDARTVDFNEIMEGLDTLLHGGKTKAQRIRERIEKKLASSTDAEKRQMWENLKAFLDSPDEEEA